MREPDFNNILKVLDKQKPDRPTLFEFFLNEPLIKELADSEIAKEYPDWEFGSISPLIVSAYKNAGYDYVTCHACSRMFAPEAPEKKESISINAGNFIYDRKSFEDFDWPDYENCDFSRLKEVKDFLSEGMKVIVFGPGGVLENVISLVGFEKLCMLMLDDPKLTEDIFAKVGDCLDVYYRKAATCDSVGALISNDDWGFKTQTMLSPEDMRKYVFPWHKKIVQTIHESEKPAILHSCGQVENVFDDIIEDMKYDGKHSYEDTIIPVEEAYDRWSDRIAILGGIDLDFVCRSRPEEIKERCKKMLERSKDKGAYALGTGNSVPEYVPAENYMAMIESINEI